MDTRQTYCRSALNLYGIAGDEIQRSKQPDTLANDMTLTKWATCVADSHLVPLNGRVRVDGERAPKLFVRKFQRVRAYLWWDHPMRYLSAQQEATAYDMKRPGVRGARKVPPLREGIIKS